MSGELVNAMEAEGAAGSAFAGQHSGFYKDREVLSLIFKPIKDYLEQRTKGTRIRIADLGCGSGLVGLYAEKMANEIGYQTSSLFIDSNPRMLSAIEEGADRKKVLSELSELPESELKEQVDIALGRQFIHYAPPRLQKRILGQIAKYVKTDGLFVNSTGTHESEEVVTFMSDYLSNILELRNPDRPARRFYQSVGTYQQWVGDVGFRRCRIEGEYSQEFRSSDFFERFGFDQTLMTPATVEQRINEILDKMQATPEVERALQIKRSGSHHSVSLTARVIVATR